CRPVQAFNAGAIAQVKTGHRVQGLVMAKGLQVVPGKPQARAPDSVRSLVLCRLGEPMYPVGAKQLLAGGTLAFGLVGNETAQRGVILAGQPSGKAGNGREGGKALQAGELVQQCLDHALEQKIAEADAAQAWLSIGDGVEDGPARLVGVVSGCVG